MPKEQDAEWTLKLLIQLVFIRGSNESSAGCSCYRCAELWTCTAGAITGMLMILLTVMNAASEAVIVSTDVEGSGCPVIHLTALQSCNVTALCTHTYCDAHNSL